MQIKSVDNKFFTIGVDGCKGGWIAAMINHGELQVQKYTSLESIVTAHNSFDQFLIDMVIGLPGSKDQIRPDSEARHIIKERASTIFPAPCRQAVYAKTVAEKYDENVRVLGKKFTPLTVGIIPKMLEVDEFLQSHPQYKNVIEESHPEVCFCRLNGSTVMSKKAELDGALERIEILKRYLPSLETRQITHVSSLFKCNTDDVLDAICLAVAGNLICQGHRQTLPENPCLDDTGLKMQMVIPSGR